MRASERQKWNARHQAGAILGALWRKVEPPRRHELNDTMVAAAARVDSTPGWFDHVFGRFGVAMEDCYIDTTAFPSADKRIDVMVAKLNWNHLREAIEENPALATMIAKNGPLPDDLAPPEDDAVQVREWTMPVPTGDLIPIPSLRSVWTNQSSMAHGADDRHGNVVLFRREPLLDLLTGQIVRCPFISGNSIRHSWRVLAVSHLYEAMGVDKLGVNPDLHHSLTSGGIIDAGSEMSKVDPGLRAVLRWLFPAFELLGGIAEKQVCHGAFNVHDATLVCRENVSRLMHPALFPVPAGLEDVAAAMFAAVGDASRRETRVAYAKALAEYLQPALSFLTLRQYTKHIDPDVETKAEARHALWNTEVVTAGAQWVHLCTVHSTASNLARSAVSHILDEFSKHPYLAAANNKGHGLISPTEYVRADLGDLPSADLYRQHIEENKGTIKEWLSTGKVPERLLSVAKDEEATAKKARKGRAA